MPSDTQYGRPLARDYLSIMASSVSSERASSQGGITISKRRSCLKGGDIGRGHYNALNARFRHDLLFSRGAGAIIS